MARIPVPLPSQADLLRLFTLREDGVLIRNWQADVPLRINKRCAGKPAGYTNKLGYIQVGIGPVLFLAHRIVWKMTHGTEPPELDHINNNPSDNRPANLREASRSENTINRRRKAGKTLPKGVHLTNCGRFTAQIRTQGVVQRLGNFTTPEAAHDAYRAAATAQHGEFARFD